MTLVPLIHLMPLLLEFSEESPALGTSGSQGKYASTDIQNPRFNTNDGDPDSIPKITADDTDRDRRAFLDWLEGDLSDSTEHPVDNHDLDAGKIPLSPTALHKPESKETKVQSQETQVLSSTGMPQRETVAISKGI